MEMGFCIDLLYLVGISEIVLEMSGNCANANKLTLDSKRFSPFRRLCSTNDTMVHLAHRPCELEVQQVRLNTVQDTILVQLDEHCLA